jgi:hypothetical protein
MSSRFDYQPRERWDRDRFERQRRNDYFQDSPRSPEIILDERIERRGPRSRFIERDRIIERDAPSFFDQRPPPEVTRQAMAPYRQERPQFMRRQSSLDTYDRRPMVRFGDEYQQLPIRRAPREQFEEELESSSYRDDDRRERRRDRRRRSRMASRSSHHRRRESSSDSTASDDSFDGGDRRRRSGRKGRTEMPKRLVHKSVIAEKGLPFDDEVSCMRV